MVPRLPLFGLLLVASAACVARPPAADAGAGGDTADTAESGGDSPDSADTTPDSEDPGDSDTGGDTGPVGEIVEDLDATATLAARIGTVAVVSWTTPEAGSSVVEWGYDDGYGFTTVDGGGVGTRHRVLLAGPASSQTIHWRVRSVYGGNTHVSADQTLRMGSLDAGPDGSFVHSGAGTHNPGFRLLPVAANGRSSVIAVDDEGRLVWSLDIDDGLVATRAQLDRGGAHVLVLVEDETRRSDSGGLLRVSLDLEDERFSPLSWCHHSFLQKEDGGFLYIAADVRTLYGEEVAGDQVVEVDADGENPRVLFSVWDYMEPTQQQVRQSPTNFWPSWKDWTHANSINASDSGGELLLSLHNTNMILALDARGEVAWSLRGADLGYPTDFSYTGNTRYLFENQHNARFVGTNRVLLFNNGASSSSSSAVEYELDEGAGTFTDVWRFNDGNEHSVALNGDVSRLPDGGTFVNWGAEGLLNEVTEDGTVVWELNASNAVLGFHDYVPRLGGAAD